MTGPRFIRPVAVLTLCVLSLAVVGLSACGYQTSAPATPPPALSPATPPQPGTGSVPSQAPAPANVTLSGFAFSPATVTVPAGTKVTWTNKDSTTHTVTSNTGAFDSGNVPVGGTFSFTFSRAGTFQYHCNIHPSMTGKIIVQ